MSAPGQISISQATFTPAAASHTAGDVFGAAQEFKGLSNYPSTGVQIISASLTVASATLVTATWRVYLYSVTPPSALADDAVFNLASGDRASFLGYVTMAQLADLGDTLYVQSDNLNKAIRPSGRGVFGYLATDTGTITPAAVAHTVTLFCMGI